MYQVRAILVVILRHEDLEDILEKLTSSKLEGVFGLLRRTRPLT
jgi:hypothetical protein